MAAGGLSLSTRTEAASHLGESEDEMSLLLLSECSQLAALAHGWCSSVGGPSLKARALRSPQDQQPHGGPDGQG